MISSKVFFGFFYAKCKGFAKKILFFEDLNADQIWSDDLSGLDDLVTLEFSSDFGGLLTIFCGILDRLEGVSIQSHLSFDVSAIRSIFFKLFVQLELQFHTFKSCWGLEVESLGVSVISDLKQKRKCLQRIQFFKITKNFFTIFYLQKKILKKIRETLFTFLSSMYMTPFILTNIFWQKIQSWNIWILTPKLADMALVNSNI